MAEKKERPKSATQLKSKSFYKSIPAGAKVIYSCLMCDKKSPEMSGTSDNEGKLM